jgi:pimeloyl-ACP methyl ester carboxylesterase
MLLSFIRSKAAGWWVVSPNGRGCRTDRSVLIADPHKVTHQSALPWRAGRAQVGGVEVAYEELGFGEPLLLIMGLSIQSIFWPDEFCGDLAARGFRVVRFDNRDIGLSSAVDRGVPVRITRDFLLSRFGIKPRANYTLLDMLDDTKGLLDHLDMASAHIVGISMGGIIAQLLAAKQPARVRSLSLIMSHTNHPVWGVPHPKVLLSMGPAPPGASREAIIERNVQGFQVLQSPAHPRSLAELRYAFAVAHDRDPRQGGSDRQTHALFATGCIDPVLKDIVAPTTVMHGTADKLVLPINARRVAARIAGARLTMFAGMGHDFPPPLLPRWAELIADNARRVG